MKRLVIILVLFSALAYGRTYTTSFPLTENPILEAANGGKWIRGQDAGGNLWGNVRTTPGLAFGVSMPTTYGDPTSIVGGPWGPDQTVQATIQIGSQPSTCCFEMELRLRTTITASSITGYEAYCSIATSDTYCHIARWGGANGLYCNIDSSHSSIFLLNGDQIKATVTGVNPVIVTMYRKRTIDPDFVQIAIATDTGNEGGNGTDCGTGHAIYTSGAPGIGFYDDQDSNWSNFGFTGFTATDGITTAWSGILDTRRAIDWTASGADPTLKANRSTVCTTLSAPQTTSQINTAINNCAAAHTADAGGIVVLNAGTYNLTTGSITLKSNVTLRGAGANLTILDFTSGSNYATGAPDSYAVGTIGTYNTSVFKTQPPDTSGGARYGAGSLVANRTAWTGTCVASGNCQSGVYAKGATILYVTANPLGVSAGSLLYLYQTNDAAPTSGFMLCNASNCSREGGASEAQFQVVKVVSVSGHEITISPGVFMPTWVTAKSPQAYYWNGGIRAAGLENLTVDVGATGPFSAISYGMTQDSWIDGVLVHQTNSRESIGLSGTRGITVRNCYFRDGCTNSGGCGGTTTAYGFAPWYSSQVLFENNIMDNLSSPLSLDQMNEGHVIAYNYDVGNWTDNPPNIYTGPIFHENGNLMYLLEGNDFGHLRADDYHGQAGFKTTFRSLLRGMTGSSYEDWAYSRYSAAVGNVVGLAGVSSTYECNAPDQPNCDGFTGGAVFRLGYICHGGAPCSQLSGLKDGVVKTTLMRWGNWNPITNAVRWCGNSLDTGWSTTCSSTSEIPTTVDYSNAVPTVETLPASFYLADKPSWFGSIVYPPIGPDVSGGNVSNTGGHANKIPSRVCYESLGAYTDFNAAVCYAPSSILNTPSPPVSLHLAIIASINIVSSTGRAIAVTISPAVTPKAGRSTTVSAAVHTGPAITATSSNVGSGIVKVCRGQ